MGLTEGSRLDFFPRAAVSHQTHEKDKAVVEATTEVAKSGRMFWLEGASPQMPHQPKAP